MTKTQRHLFVFACIVLGLAGMVFSYFFAPDRTQKPHQPGPSTAPAAVSPSTSPASGS